MAFFLVDDTAHAHPKFKRAGDDALGMWVRAGSHCRAYKSEGFIPLWWVTEQRGGTKKAAQLVDAGLWIPCESEGEQGYRFHDWHHIHDSADETERQREAGRERQRRRRQRVREATGSKGADK